MKLKLSKTLTQKSCGLAAKISSRVSFQLPYLKLQLVAYKNSVLRTSMRSMRPYFKAFEFLEFLIGNMEKIEDS